MYVDKELLLCDNQSVTADAASENIIDLGIARNIGVGENLYIHVNVDVLTAGSAVTLKMQSDSVEAFSSAVDGQIIGTFADASAVGSKLIARIQPDMQNERYIRLYFDVATTLTAGSFTAAIVHNIDAYTAYADNITIS